MKIVIVMIMLSLMGCKAKIESDDFIIGNCDFLKNPDCEVEPPKKKK